MKILLVSSSPRGEKSATYHLAREIAAGAAAAGAEIETEHLHGRRLGFCHACDACHRGSMACPIRDDAHILILKMLNADGLIFATPNYINQVTAQLKTLLDRTSNLIHCQRLLGKYAAGAVSSGSGHNGPVTEYLAAYARLCGAQWTGAVSCGHAAHAADQKAARELGARLAGDIAAKAAYPEQLAEIEERRKFFAEIIKRRAADWDAEHRYYASKGWL